MSEWWPLKFRVWSLHKTDGWNAATVRFPNGIVLMVHDFRHKGGQYGGGYYIENEVGAYLETVADDLLALKCALARHGRVDVPNN